MKTLLISIALILLQSCTEIQYKKDTGYVLPVVAGALESLVYIDAKPCKDMDGIVGICSKRLYRNRNLVINIPPKNYAYNLNVVCSKAINFNHNYDVANKEKFKVEINSELLENVSQFTCIGSIAPMDRGIVSHKFEIRVRLIDSDYVSRNEIVVYKKNLRTYLVLGQHSRYVQVFKKGKWKFYNKKTYIRVKKSDLGTIKVVSESLSGRMTYYNL